MKTDFSINVNVSIGVTPEVVALVTSILTKQPTATVEAPAGEQPAAEAPAEAPTPAPAAPKRGRKAKTQAAEAPANEPEPQAEEAAAPAGDSAEAPASEQPAAEAPAGGKALTVEDVREAMRRARVRIEGEDWETNTTGEGYTKYHRQLNATFKNIAALLGSDKPSTLSEDKFASFIKQCDELIVDADGTITTKCPY